jgi:hypothetical protein
MVASVHAVGGEIRLPALGVILNFSPRLIDEAVMLDDLMWEPSRQMLRVAVQALIGTPRLPLNASVPAWQRRAAGTGGHGQRGWWAEIAGLPSLSTISVLASCCMMEGTTHDPFAPAIDLILQLQRKAQGASTTHYRGGSQQPLSL